MYILPNYIKPFLLKNAYITIITPPALFVNSKIYKSFSIFLGVPFRALCAYNVITKTVKAERNAFMEYILINDSKLKIILDSHELTEWDIHVDELDYANPAARQVFEGLLGYAKKELGFDTTGYKILLQLFPSKDGGCELFVTRLGQNSEAPPKRHPRERKTAEQRAYSFDKLSHLLAVCKRLSESEFDGESSAWFDIQGRWFLLLSSYTAGDLCFISEYGEDENPKAAELYLCEYGTAVSKKNAASILGKI